MADFLTAAGAGRILGVTPSAVHLMVQRGELRVASRTEGGILLFTRVDVETLASLRAERQTARRRA
jgi:DNA-binding transcriptional MerR regulator